MFYGKNVSSNVFFVACASNEMMTVKNVSKGKPQIEYRTKFVSPTGVSDYTRFYGRIDDEEISWKDKGFYILFEKDNQKKIGVIPLDSNKIRIYNFLDFPSWDFGYPNIGLCIGESYTKQEYESFFSKKCRKEIEIDSATYNFTKLVFDEQKESIKQLGTIPQECLGESLNVIYYDGFSYRYFDMPSPKCFDDGLKNKSESIEYVAFYEMIDKMLDQDFLECRWDNFVNREVVDKCISKYKQLRRKFLHMGFVQS